jgi:hypothetical protein
VGIDAMRDAASTIRCSYVDHRAIVVPYTPEVCGRSMRQQRVGTAGEHCCHLASVRIETQIAHRVNTVVDLVQ